MGRPFPDAVEKQLCANVQIAQRRELHTFAVVPQLLVVERSFARIAFVNRLPIGIHRKPDRLSKGRISLAVIHPSEHRSRNLGKRPANPPVN